MHDGDYHSVLAIGHCSWNKRYWSHGEKVLFAREEICVCGTSRNLNLDLSMAFPDRTFQAIKGLQKNPAYCALVEEPVYTCNEGHIYKTG